MLTTETENKLPGGSTDESSEDVFLRCQLLLVQAAARAYLADMAKETGKPLPETSSAPLPSQTPAETPPARPKEIGGPKGPEPTRYGDWERNGRVSDF